MVQTYESPVWVYKHPFELVMKAYEKRFPICPLMPILVSSEILSESESPDGSVLITERLCKLHLEAPYLIRKIIGVENVSFVQKNRLDRGNRTLTIEVRNLTFATRVFGKEFCRYYVHPENDEWTSYEQSAFLDVQSFFGLEHVVEKAAIKHYTNNLHTGKKVLEKHIEEVLGEGSVPPLFTGVKHGKHLALAELSRAESKKNGSTTRQPWKFSSRRSSAKPDSGSWKNANARRIRAASLESKAPSTDAKLEAEYIQRFLGHLTSLEESRLVELRNSLTNSHTGKTPNDAHLLRFLRACDFEVDRARETVLKSITWRKQHGVDRILSAYQAPPVFASHFPATWHGHDLEGHPLYLLRLGLLDFKGLFKAVGEEGLVKYVLSVCEEGLRLAEEATEQFGKPISAWTVLLDLEGFSVRHLWRPAIGALLNIIEIVQDNYPETMATLLIVGAGRVFTALWTLIQPFISEQTSKKIHMVGNEALRTYIDEAFVPDFVGGCCAVELRGGRIPKSFYIPEMSVAPGHGLEQMYTTVRLCKSYYHEVLAQVSQRDSVLTWDFDVVKGTCVFVVLYTENMVSGSGEKSTFARAESAIAQASGMKSTGLVGSAAITSDLSFNATNNGKTMLEDTRALCNEAESIQGTLKCDKLGTYILQWVCTDALTDNQLPFDCPLPMINTSKCKVVYYCELLDPDSVEDAELERGRCAINALSVR